MFTKSQLTMRKLNNSKIIFNSTNGIYKPGEILTGSVEINFNSAKTVRAIFIEIIGKADVYWSESDSLTDSSGNSTTASTSYSNKEKYFKEKFYVVGKEKSDEKTELAPGQYVYCFKYLLPSTIPPSFKGRDGKIVYSVKATLDRPWKIDQYVEAPFIVETLNTFQEQPLVMEPKVITMEKQFGVILKSKPLKATVTIPNSGVAPGQVIPLKLEVDNSSNTAVNYVSVKFKQVTTFYATTRDSKEEKTLSKNPIKFQIKPKTYKSFNHTLTVPKDVILHDLNKCKIIDIDYELRVELHAAGFSTNLIGKIPLYPVVHCPLNATDIHLGPHKYSPN